MKPPQFDPNSDNWAWPEKTWFQERLNAMRARRHEAHRKPATNQKEPVAVETKNSGDPSKNKSPVESQKTISQTAYLVQPNFVRSLFRLRKTQSLL
jgi:hypothetical protein